MYIQNYNDLDEKCKEEVEYLGHIARAILSLERYPEVTNPHRHGLVKAFRRGLMDLSGKCGRPIEVCDVRGEVWINIRERVPIPREAIEKFILGENLIITDKAAAPPVNMADEVKSQWNW